jgi:hypothetical protein
MKNFREKYDFWTDRKVGDYIYRFNDGEIRRCRADDPARHFKRWRPFDSPFNSIKTWRTLCDQSAAKKEI